MKRDQRLLLIGDGTGWLCGSCRYSEWNTWGTWESGPEWEQDCTHPLEAVVNNHAAGNVEPGRDCWGFRPRKSVAAPKQPATGNRAEGALKREEGE